MRHSLSVKGDYRSAEVLLDGEPVSDYVSEIVIRLRASEPIEVDILFAETADSKFGRQPTGTYTRHIRQNPIVHLDMNDPIDWSAVPTELELIDES